MGEVSKIAWTDGTMNFWWGCTKWSPGCDLCYAATFDKRLGGDHWGKDKPRRTFGDKHWNDPLRWNRKAEKAGVRMRVFCMSMADWADAEVPTEWRDRMWSVIRQCPWIDWLMLTKRAENILGMLPSDWGRGWPNVWMGITVEDQKRTARIEHLLRVPAVVRWLSVEPQIGDVDLRCIPANYPGAMGDMLDALSGCEFYDQDEPSGTEPGNPAARLGRIHWVVTGGESGHSAREFDLDWARKTKAQCEASGTAWFMKQTGSNCAQRIFYQVTGKGDDPAEWPEDLRVRQFPVIYNGAVVDSRSVVAKAARGEITTRDGSAPGDDPMGSPVF